MVLNSTKRRNSKMLQRVYGVTVNGVEVPYAYYADGRRGVVRSHAVIEWKDTRVLSTIERRGKVGWLKRGEECR